MRILVITARYPEEGGKGDQLRIFAFVRQLARRHKVVVVTSARPSSEFAATALREYAAVIVRPAGATARAASAADAVRHRLPGQVGWMMPARSWAAALEVAPDFDVALAVTVRSLRGQLGIPTVLDHIDALSLNMQRRAAGPESGVRRWAALGEARALRRYERRAAGWVGAQVVTAREDADHLPAVPAMTVIPCGWDSEKSRPRSTLPRDIDVIFTGNMAYPPNREAAEWFASEIVPELARRRDGVRSVVVGRDANSLDVDGVEVASDVLNLRDYLERSKVAVVPLRGLGTGSPNKLLEAAACGAAIVSTSWAQSRFDVPCAVAEDADGFAREIDRLLTSEELRERVTEEAFRALDEHSVERTTAQLEGVLEAVATAGRAGV